MKNKLPNVLMGLVGAFMGIAAGKIAANHFDTQDWLIVVLAGLVVGLIPTKVK